MHVKWLEHGNELISCEFSLVVIVCFSAIYMHFSQSKFISEIYTFYIYHSPVHNKNIKLSVNKLTRTKTTQILIENQTNKHHHYHEPCSSKTFVKQNVQIWFSIRNCKIK